MEAPRFNRVMVPQGFEAARLRNLEMAQQMEAVPGSVKSYFGGIIGGREVLSNEPVLQAFNSGDRARILQAVTNAAIDANLNPVEVVTAIGPHLPQAKGIGFFNRLGTQARSLASSIRQEGHLKNLLNYGGMTMQGLAAVGTVYGTGQLAYEGGKYVYNGIGNVINWIRDITPYGKGTDEISKDVNKITGEVIKTIAGGPTLSNEHTTINNILKVMGKEGFPAIHRPALQAQLEDNVLSYLKRQLKASMEDVISLDQFRTSAMRNRALSLAPVHPQLIGYPSRIV